MTKTFFSLIKTHPKFFKSQSLFQKLWKIKNILLIKKTKNKKLGKKIINHLQAKNKHHASFIKYIDATHANNSKSTAKKLVYLIDQILNSLEMWEDARERIREMGEGCRKSPDKANIGALFDELTDSVVEVVSECAKKPNEKLAPLERKKMEGVAKIIKETMLL